jgi:hypothetical protein
MKFGNLIFLETSGPVHTCPGIGLPLLQPEADPDGHTVEGAGLRPFDCWDGGFESR